MATIKTIYSGSSQMASVASVTTSIGGTVDLSKSILFFSQKTESGSAPKTLMVAGKISSTTQVYFEREDPGTSTVDINWWVVEYASGVTVQRGEFTTFDAGTPQTKDVTITAVDLSKSWPLVNYNHSGNSIDETNWVGGSELTSTTNLKIRVNSTSGTYNVYWQVVTYDNCSVQKVSKTLTTGTSDSSTISSVAVAKTIVVGDVYGDADSNTDHWWQWYVSDSTTLSFVTDNSGAFTMNGVFYVISFTDDVAVYQSDISIINSLQTATAAIGATVVTNRSVMICKSGYAAGLTYTNNGTGVMTNVVVTTTFSSTTFTASRTGTGGAIPTALDQLVWWVSSPSLAPKINVVFL